MRQLEKNNQGMILLIVLLVLCVIMMMSVGDRETVIMNIKMQSALKNHVDLFSYAEMAREQVVLSQEGVNITLPDSNIRVSSVMMPIKKDRCGNQIVQIKIIARLHQSKIILNSEDIFAKVPKKRRCKRIRKHSVLWWNQRTD